MLDLLENVSDGVQYIVTLSSNAIKHYMYLPDLYNTLRDKTTLFMSYVPEDLQGLLWFSISTALILKVVKWGH